MLALAQENAENREEGKNRRDNGQNINSNQGKNELGSNQDPDLEHARDDTGKPKVETKTEEENPLAAASSVE